MCAHLDSWSADANTHGDSEYPMFIFDEEIESITRLYERRELLLGGMSDATGDSFGLATGIYARTESSAEALGTDVAVLLSHSTVDVGVRHPPQPIDDDTSALILKDIGSWISYTSLRKTSMEFLFQCRTQPPDNVVQDDTTQSMKKDSGTKGETHSSFVVPSVLTDQTSEGTDSWLDVEDTEAHIIDDIASRVMQCMDHCAALDRLGDIGPDAPTAWYFSLNGTAMGGSERCVCALSELLVY